jgi:hypothetical protein
MENTDMKWRKSRYSGNGGGNCVELAADHGRVLVRDSKNRTGGMITVDGATWRRFVEAIKAGRLDLPRSLTANRRHPTVGDSTVGCSRLRG